MSSRDQNCWQLVAWRDEEGPSQAPSCHSVASRPLEKEDGRSLCPQLPSALASADETPPYARRNKSKAEPVSMGAGSTGSKTYAHIKSTEVLT